MSTVHSLDPLEDRITVAFAGEVGALKTRSVIAMVAASAEKIISRDARMRLMNLNIRTSSHKNLHGKAGRIKVMHAPPGPLNLRNAQSHTVVFIRSSRMLFWWFCEHLKRKIRPFLSGFSRFLAEITSG